MSSDLGSIGIHTACITSHLKSLAGNTLGYKLARMHSKPTEKRTYTTHVSASSSREQCRCCQRIDPFFPLVTRFLRRVDILELLPDDLVDRVSDPSDLDLNAAGPVGQECRTMRSIHMEHVWITGDGGSQVGISRCFPLILEVCVIDALEAHVHHTTSDLAKPNQQGKQTPNCEDLPHQTQLPGR